MVAEGVYTPGSRYLGWGADPSLRFAKFICLPGKPNRAHRVYRGPNGLQFETIKALMVPLAPKVDRRPHCAKADCPQRGRKMYLLRSRAFQTKDGTGKTTITYFQCRPRSAQSHYAYQGPAGEEAIRVLPDGQIGVEGQDYYGGRGGYFRFTDSATSQIVETKFGENPDGVRHVGEAAEAAWKDRVHRKLRQRKLGPMKRTSR